MGGMSTPPPLPDSFDVALGQRMSAAHAAGDRTAVERARAYLVAEGSSSPQEASFLEEYTRALALTQDMVAAQGAGDTARSTDLARQITRDFAPEIVRQVQLGMLFAAGRQQGWLREADYDALAAATSAGGPEVAEQMRHIRRGEPS